MHPKIKTTEAHEIGHVHFINRGTMVPLFIRYHKLTPFRRIASPPRGARRAEDRHSVFNQSHALQSERNFETKLIGDGPLPRRICAHRHWPVSAAMASGDILF